MTLRLPLSWTKSRFSMYCRFYQSARLILGKDSTHLLELGLRLRHCVELGSILRDTASVVEVFLRGCDQEWRSEDGGCKVGTPFED